MKYFPIKLPKQRTSRPVFLTSKINFPQVKTFLIMYRAHCQRILDTILRANFGEVSSIVEHFLMYQFKPSNTKKKKVSLTFYFV